MKRTQFIFLWCLLLIACTSGPSEAQTVYITKTGAKYHDSGCRYLHSSKIPIALKEASARGYTACSVCGPSTEEESDVTNASNSGSAQGSSAASFSRPTEAGTQGTSTTRKTTTTSSRCTASTKAGARCKRTATAGSDRCWQHQ